LIEIAHPDVRAELLSEAKARHYLLPDHPMPNVLPAQQAQVVVAKTGERVQITPVRVSDEDALQELLYGLSDESSFFRFFGHRVTHPRQEVLRMVEVDEACSAALVARVADTEELIGISRLDADPSSSASELGVTVADAWQGRGVGSALLETLIEVAREKGLTRVMAAVLPGNIRMQRLLRRRGFTCTGNPGDSSLMFELSLREEAA
jgi:ribosomal protein S18 acetylase RimI-like enzyme